MWLFALLLGAVISDLDPSCTTGDYEVTGTSTGKAVTLNYTASSLDVSGVVTTLTLTYNVPSMLFYNDSQEFRGLEVTFHNRDTGDSSSCYARNEWEISTICPTPHSSWTATEDGCNTELSADLSYDDLMNGQMDPSLIAIQEGTTTVNGITTPTWEIFMDSMIETWVPYTIVSDDAGVGNLDFNNPDYTQDMGDDHLTISTTMRQFYHIPFLISIPQQIQVAASTIQSSAQLVALYAIVDQKTLEIDFDTTSGAFAVADIVLRTQVQNPFALLGTDQAAGSGPPTIAKDSDATTTANIDTVEFTSFDASCSSDSAAGYCEQNWYITITPLQCDVSGTFAVDFYAFCEDSSVGCPLNTGTDQFAQTSNRWTGVQKFSIEAQEFCPTVLDEILVEGNIAAYASDDLATAAVPGTNVFVNDHVFFEATFTTKSQQSGLDFTDGDDSLIEFVRPYLITMTVAMVQEPLQYTVNDGGDVTVTDASNYMVELCSATALNFDYTSSASADDCFQTSNMGWNSINTLAFGEVTPSGSNSVDANEIAFRLRLDERVIPVDDPNSPSTITISVDTEVYYVGNTNPVRRRLTARRTLQEVSEDARLRSVGASTSMTITREPVSYCPLKASVAYTGFRLNMITDPMELPTHENIEDHVMATRHQLTQYLDIPTDQLHIVQVDRCVEESCSSLYPEIQGELDNSALNTVHYYVDVRNKDAANKLQDDLYSSAEDLLASDFMHQKALKDMSADHCDSDLQQTFNDFRTSEETTDFQALEESSAAMFSFFLFSVLALLY